MAVHLVQQDRMELPQDFWEQKAAELQDSSTRVVEEALLTIERIAQEHLDGIKREIDIRAIIEEERLLPAMRTIFDHQPVLTFNVLRVLEKYLRIYDVDFIDCDLDSQCSATGIRDSIMKVPFDGSLNFCARRLAIKILDKYFRSILALPRNLTGHDSAIENPAMAHYPLGRMLPQNFWLQKMRDFQSSNPTIVYEALETMRALADLYNGGVLMRYDDITAFERIVSKLVTPKTSLLGAFGSIIDRRSPQLDNGLLVLKLYLDIYKRQNNPGLRNMVRDEGILQKLRDLQSYMSLLESIKVQIAGILRDHFSGEGQPRQERGPPAY